MPALPLGTLLVNVAGSLLIGIGWSTIGNDTTRLLLLTGLLGGFTHVFPFHWKLFVCGKMAR